MRLVNFEAEDGARLGVRRGEELVDLALADPRLPRDLNGLLSGGPQALETVRSVAAAAKADAVRPLAGLRILPPNQRPSKIICLGVNFAEHAHEAGLKAPEFPPIFLRGPSSLVGQGEPLVRPAVSEQLDWEAELAVFIGRRARHVASAEALSFVAGYSAFNDGSIRDFQLRTSQWTMGKNFDGTGAFGPEFVSVDEVPPGALGLRLQTRLNGQVMQDASTSEMIFGVAEAVAILTEAMTLLPGDVVVMGTCAGVGVTRKPPMFMKPGDICEVEIEGVGVLSNPVVQEETVRRAEPSRP